jgi:hypothetical protein
MLGDGWWAENEGGLLTQQVHTFEGSGGGNVAGGLEAILHVAALGMIVPDWNRDRSITEADFRHCSHIIDNNLTIVEEKQ